MRQAFTDLAHRFQRLYGRTPELYRAPGRVNLIGEHTDYNDGFVMPAAVNLYCNVAASVRSDRELHLHSETFVGSAVIDLDHPPQTKSGTWSDYVVGTAVTLEKMGFQLPGANLLISGEVPPGSGLSSSAAVEVATGFALLDLAGVKVDLRKLAIACRRSENEFVGARVGIMDQFISANGEANHALMLDCRSLEFKLLPIRNDVCLVVCNTGVRHSIAGGEYNERRAQCEQGVQRLVPVLPSITALRDVSLQELEEHRALLPELIYRRCHHVVSENARVEKAAAALKRDELPVFGRLMAESHRSLRDDYEVSCKELDTMVEIAWKQAGLIGARMTGGGFGGCTVNLVESSSAETFRANVAAEYEKRTGISPDIYILSAASGAQKLQEWDLA